MKFVDEAVIRVQAGDGGNGCVSFRRRSLFPTADRTAVMAAMVEISTCWPIPTSTP